MKSRTYKLHPVWHDVGLHMK